MILHRESNSVLVHTTETPYVPRLCEVVFYGHGRPSYCFEPFTDIVFDQDGCTVYVCADHKESFDKYQALTAAP